MLWLGGRRVLREGRLNAIELAPPDVGAERSLVALILEEFHAKCEGIITKHNIELHGLNEFVEVTGVLTH